MKICEQFKVLVFQCPTHGLLDKVLLEFFYKGLDFVNRGVVYQYSMRELTTIHNRVKTP